MLIMARNPTFYPQEPSLPYCDSANHIFYLTACPKKYHNTPKRLRRKRENLSAKRLIQHPWKISIKKLIQPCDGGFYGSSIFSSCHSVQASTSSLPWFVILLFIETPINASSTVTPNCSQGRSDLANAKIAGMSQELNLSPRDYSNAATTFLISYLLFQLPGTLLVKKIGPPIQFSGAMILVCMTPIASTCYSH